MSVAWARSLCLCWFTAAGHRPLLSLQNLGNLAGVKNPTEALQWVREYVGDATIFCGGTMATSSRGVSYYSEGNFGCPTTLLNVTSPRGHCTEGTSQAFMRFCGGCSPAFWPLLCVIAAAACRVPPTSASRACRVLAKPCTCTPVQVPGAACASLLLH